MHVSQEGTQRENHLQEQVHNGNASLAHLKREKDEVSNSLKEKSLQLADLQREAADKKRALDTECEKLSREKHKRQRVEEDNKVCLLCFAICCQASLNAGKAFAEM